jgi:A/G-specific adenine glycosylase
MLQQTQVATVVPYFERFIEAFPTIESLARAPEQRVLRLWEGLGYYRRARQLHKAAKLVVQEFDGRFPSDPEAVRALPGIGRYTSGAILSIAFEDRQPILEANTTRLFSRLLAYRGDPMIAKGQSQLWSFAEAILPRRNVGDFNQALMELGGAICTPREPSCDACPIAPLCATFAQGLQEKIPLTRRRMNYESVSEACVVVRRAGRILLRQCAEGERWAGLWDFPRFAVARDENESKLREQIAKNVNQQTGVSITVGPRITTIRHGVTRYRITLDCYEGVYRRGPLKRDQQRWVEADRLEAYPLSVTGRKIAERLG